MMNGDDDDQKDDSRLRRRPNSDWNASGATTYLVVYCTCS